MRLNIRSCTFAMVLAGPLVWSVAVTPSTLAVATNTSPSGLLGPNAPALIDTNGNGQPDANDFAVVPLRHGNTISLVTPWDCDGTNNNSDLTLLKSEGSTKFDGLLHKNGPENQVVRFTQFANGSPVGGEMAISDDCPTTCDGVLIDGQGTARLRDQNGDGAIDGWEAAGSNSGETIRISMDFVQTNGFISIPWAMASLIGVPASPSCGGPLPQVFIPLADFDGDGVPDGVGFDLDGDGHPDPEFFTSPRLTPGCTSGLGYWKTHAGAGPQADVLSAGLPILLGSSGGAKTLTISTAAQAIGILNFEGSSGAASASNGINKLYAQLLTAKLNRARAAVPASIASIIAAADAFLATHDSSDWASLPNAARQQVLAWMTALESYNSGVAGIDACQ